MNRLLRKEKILELLKQNGKVLVKELSVLFENSEVTLRTDLKELEQQGKLKRFFGGAQSISSLPLSQKESERELDPRYEINKDAKHNIAVKAASFVKKGDTIIIDSGSSTHLVAEQLAIEGGITVITNNLAASFSLMSAPDTTMVITGGAYRSKTKSLHGSHGEQFFNGVQADILFVGADGIDPVNGITTFNEGCSITHVMANCAQKVVAIVDSSKLQRVGFNKVLSTKQIDVLVIDDGIADSAKAQFAAAGVDVVVVEHYLAESS